MHLQNEMENNAGAHNMCCVNSSGMGLLHRRLANWLLPERKRCNCQTSGESLQWSAKIKCFLWVSLFFIVSCDHFHIHRPLRWQLRLNSPIGASAGSEASSLRMGVEVKETQLKSRLSIIFIGAIIRAIIKEMVDWRIPGRVNCVVVWIWRDRLPPPEDYCDTYDSDDGGD